MTYVVYNVFGGEIGPLLWGGTDEAAAVAKTRELASADAPDEEDPRESLAYFQIQPFDENGKPGTPWTPEPL